MAGARIRIEIDDAQARAALDRLAKAGADLTPAMKEIGETLINSTRQRFFDHEAPDGTPWAPLTETTKRRKTRNVNKILTEEGTLRGGIAYQAGPDPSSSGAPMSGPGRISSGRRRGRSGRWRTALPSPEATSPPGPSSASPTRTGPRSSRSSSTTSGARPPERPRPRARGRTAPSPERARCSGSAPPRARTDPTPVRRQAVGDSRKGEGAATIDKGGLSIPSRSREGGHEAGEAGRADGA